MQRKEKLPENAFLPSRLFRICAMTLVFSQGGGSTSSRFFTCSSTILMSARALRQDAHVSRCASMRFISVSGSAPSICRKQIFISLHVMANHPER